MIELVSQHDQIIRKFLKSNNIKIERSVKNYFVLKEEENILAMVGMINHQIKTIYFAKELDANQLQQVLDYAKEQFKFVYVFLDDEDSELFLKQIGFKKVQNNVLIW